MKKWFDYTIEERIEINKQQGFTIDILYPKGIERRKDWDKMIKETEKNLQNHFSRKELERKEDVLNLSPEELLKKKT